MPWSSRVKGRKSSPGGLDPCSACMQMQRGACKTSRGGCDGVYQPESERRGTDTSRRWSLPRCLGRTMSSPGCRSCCVPGLGCMSRHHQNSCLHPGGEEADANMQAAWAEASWSKSKAQFEENPGLQRKCAIRKVSALN